MDELNWSDVCIEDELRRAVKLLEAANELHGCSETATELASELFIHTLVRFRELNDAFHRSKP